MGASPMGSLYCMGIVDSRFFSSARSCAVSAVFEIKTGKAFGLTLPAMRLQAAVIKKAGYVIVNIADVTIDGKIVPRWTVECRKAAGLAYKGLEHPYELNYRFGLQGDGAASEPVFVFKKR